MKQDDESIPAYLAHLEGDLLAREEAWDKENNPFVVGKAKEDAEKRNPITPAQERLKAAMAIYTGDDKLISSLELAEEMKTRPEEPKIMTGYGSLDTILKGFRAKQLVVVSAATKSGKTSFCIELTTRMRAENPLWLPFEEGAEELIQKFLDRGEEPPLFYTPQTMQGNTLLWVEKKIIEAKVKYDSKIVFIDHLHFIVPMSGDRHDLAIGQAMRELKRMAKTWDVVVVLIAHLKKTRMDVSPTLEDLRDSSFVAQEADTVLTLYREAHRNNDGDMEVSNKVSVSVLANRRTGKTGIVKMVYNDGKFTEEEWKRDDPGGLKDW